MHRLRKTAVAALLALVTVLIGLTAVAHPAAASSFDPSFPSSWYRQQFWASGGQPTTLHMDAQWAGGNGSPVWLWPANNDPAQVWVNESASEGGFYLHPGYNRWLCLDFDGDRGYGVPVKVNTCDGSSSQRWFSRFYNADSAYENRLAIATHSDFQFCIDVPGSNFSQGQTLQLWGCNDTGAQKFGPTGCINTVCQGLDPTVFGCTDHTITLEDVTLYGVTATRLTIQGSLRYNCATLWARVAAGDSSTDRYLVFERYNAQGALLDWFQVLVAPFAVVWTPMYAQDVEFGRRFRACWVDEVRPPEPQGNCTPFYSS